MEKNNDRHLKWREKNREKERIRSKEYRAKNREQENLRTKEYREKNRDKYLETQKKYREKNKEKEIERYKKYREKNKQELLLKIKEYQKNNKETINNRRRVRSKERKINDPIFKLRCNMTTRIHKFLRQNNIKKNSKTFDIIGCLPEELKEYIESKFTINMSWDKLGDEIHIDHIIPLSSAKNEEEVYKLCHYTNLQPLWAKDNLLKGAKIIPQ